MWIFLFIFLIVAWPELPVLLAVLKHSRALLFCSPVIIFSLLSLDVLLSLIWYHTLLRKPCMCILRTGAFRLEHCACFIKEASLYTPWCVPHTCAHIHEHFRQDLPAFPPRQTFSSQHLLYIYTYIECHIRPVIWKPQKKKKIKTCIIRWPWCLLLFLTMWPHCVRLSVLVFVCTCTVSLQDVAPKVRAGLALWHKQL